MVGDGQSLIHMVSARSTHVDGADITAVREQPRVEVALYHRRLPPGPSRRFFEGIPSGFSARLGVHGYHIVARRLLKQWLL